jgi:hypothetical protein
MALRFIDSFDHYSGGALPLKWSIVSGATIATVPRTGSQSLVCDAQNDYAAMVLDNQATWIVGFAYRQITAGATGLVCSFRDEASIQCDVRLSNGVLTVTRNGTVLATGTTFLLANTWYYIEFKATINNSGSFELRLNGVVEVSGSGVDTQSTANAYANRFYCEIAGVNDAYFDDLYILDSTGSTNNNFLGDVRVEALFPNGNGNSSLLDGSDGNQTDNYLLVDETPPNSDTDYVESSDVGDKDTYTYSNLTTTAGTVYGVQIVSWSRKTDAGARSIRQIARVSGSEADSPSDIELSTSYRYFSEIRETKPGGGSWTISDVNGAEFGVKITV